jgi:hypothetical protein
MSPQTPAGTRTHVGVQIETASDRVAVLGVLSPATVLAVCEALPVALRLCPGDVTIDLSGVQQLSDRALRALMVAVDELATRGHDLRVESGPGTVAHHALTHHALAVCPPSDARTLPAATGPPAAHRSRGHLRLVASR